MKKLNVWWIKKMLEEQQRRLEELASPSPLRQLPPPSQSTIVAPADDLTVCCFCFHDKILVALIKKHQVSFAMRNVFVNGPYVELIRITMGSMEVLNWNFSFTTTDACVKFKLEVSVPPHFYWW
jgi:hypothetical protein